MFNPCVGKKELFVQKILCPVFYYLFLIEICYDQIIYLVSVSFGDDLKISF